MIASFPTSREPMRSFVDDIKAREGKDGILSISIAHGFPFGDVPGMGTKVLVVTDDHAELGALLAKELGERLFAMRGQTAPPFLGVDEGIDRALAIEGGPVVIADPSDNPGGGAPSDATAILRALIDRGVARRGDRADLGPDRGAVLRRRRRGRQARPALCRQDRAGLGPADRCRGRDPARRQGRHPDLRPVGRRHGRLRGRADRRHRHRADHAPPPGLRHRPVRQSRHRSRRQEDRGREVDQPFLCVVRADREGGAVRRFRRAPAARSAHARLSQDRAAEMAVRRAAVRLSRTSDCARRPPR